MARNRNIYGRTRVAREYMSDMYDKYPWLSKSSPIMALMARKYAHPDEVDFAIQASYDGEIPDDDTKFKSFLSSKNSPYNSYMDDMWDMIMSYGPATMEDIGALLPSHEDGLTRDGNEGSDVARYIESLIRGDGSIEADDAEVILNNFGEQDDPNRYDDDDKFNKFEDHLLDLFDDARAQAATREQMRTFLDGYDDDEEYPDTSTRWIYKLRDKRKKDKDSDGIDSNGNSRCKGPDGIEGTGDCSEDIPNKHLKSNDDKSRDDILSDSTQKNIINALLQHSL